MASLSELLYINLAWLNKQTNKQNERTTGHILSMSLATTQPPVYLVCVREEGVLEENEMPYALDIIQKDCCYDLILDCTILYKVCSTMFRRVITVPRERAAFSCIL